MFYIDLPYVIINIGCNNLYITSLGEPLRVIDWSSAIYKRTCDTALLFSTSSKILLLLGCSLGSFVSLCLPFVSCLRTFNSSCTSQAWLWRQSNETRKNYRCHCSRLTRDWIRCHVLQLCACSCRRRNSVEAVLLLLYLLLSYLSIPSPRKELTTVTIFCKSPL